MKSGITRSNLTTEFTTKWTSTSRKTSNLDKPIPVSPRCYIGALVNLVPAYIAGSTVSTLIHLHGESLKQPLRLTPFQLSPVGQTNREYVGGRVCSFICIPCHLSLGCESGGRCALRERLRRKDCTRACNRQNLLIKACNAARLSTNNVVERLLSNALSTRVGKS